MKTSANGIKELRASEGVRREAYLDSVGVWTIGVGHTASAGLPAPKKGMVISDAEVDEILARDLVLFEKAVENAVKVPLNQNQFDALVNWTFNVGTGAMAKSTLVRKLNAKDYQGAADQFRVWNKAGGEVLKGLVTRRERERALFLAPVKATEAPTAPSTPTPATTPKETRPNPWVTLLIVLWNKLRGK